MKQIVKLNSCHIDSQCNEADNTFREIRLHEYYIRWKYDGIEQLDTHFYIHPLNIFGCVLKTDKIGKNESK